MLGGQDNKTVKEQILEMKDDDSNLPLKTLRIE